MLDISAGGPWPREDRCLALFGRALGSPHPPPPPKNPAETQNISGLSDPGKVSDLRPHWRTLAGRGLWESIHPGV